MRKNPYVVGQRAVMEVLEVTGDSDGRVTRARIFGAGPDGRAARDPEVGIVRAHQLAAHGYHDGVHDALGWRPTDPGAGDGWIGPGGLR